MILLTVLSLNIFGDGLRDALDPRSKVRLEAHAGMVEPRAGARSDLMMPASSSGAWSGWCSSSSPSRSSSSSIFNVIPNSPPAQRLAGKNATPTLVKSIEEEWGFDESLPEQYVTMMKKVFTGELISYAPRLTVERPDRRRDPGDALAGIGAGDHLALLRDAVRLPLGDHGPAAGSTGS